MMRAILAVLLGPPRADIEAGRPSHAARIARLDADIERSLKSRAEDRAQRQETAREREATKRRRAFETDRLVNQRWPS